MKFIISKKSRFATNLEDFGLYVSYSDYFINIIFKKVIIYIFVHISYSIVNIYDLYISAWFYKTIFKNIPKCSITVIFGIKTIHFIIKLYNLFIHERTAQMIIFFISFHILYEIEIESKN